MTKITYEEYDRIVERCEVVLKKSKDGKLESRKNFFPGLMYPSVEDLEKNNVANNISKYLPFLIFWDSVDANEIFGGEVSNRFLKSKKKINQYLRENLEFCEDRVLS